MTNTPIMRNKLLRTACDRCHSQKLRCPRPSKADSEKGDKTCNRCRRAGKICVFSKRGKSGRPSKIVTAGAQLRSSFLAQPAESEISTRGSTSPPENPPPDVSNAEAILDSVTVQSESGAPMETSGSVRHSTEDTRTLSISDVPLPSCTLGQEAMPAPTVLSVSTLNSDYQPLGLETDSTQTLEEVPPDFPMTYDLDTCQFNSETQSVPASQMSKSPSGLGSETWSEFLLSSNISYSNDIPNLGVQLHHTFDKQGSIFSNSNPAPSDLSSSGHYPFIDCGSAINPHPFGDVAGELSGLNYRITCALANYKATAIIDDFHNLQLYQVVQDIIDISRQLIAITKQCLPYIPTTPDSSLASSPSSAVDELPEGSSRTSPALCKPLHHPTLSLVLHV
nr:Zn(II)2-Cys6 binuclear cluster domain-like protein [Fusarium sp. NRRL 13405]